MELGLPSSTVETGIVASQVLAKERSNDKTRFGVGNTAGSAGRPRIALFRKWLIRHLRTEVAPGLTRADIIADKVVSLAEAGKMEAVVFLRDTVDGLPVRREFGEVGSGGITINIASTAPVSVAAPNET